MKRCTKCCHLWRISESEINEQKRRHGTTIVYEPLSIMTEDRPQLNHVSRSVHKQFFYNLFHLYCLDKSVTPTNMNKVSTKECILAVF